MRRPRPWQRAVTGSGIAATGDPERGTLDKAAGENFPVAPFFLPKAWRTDLMAVYGFARLVDDIGDGDLAPAAPTPGCSALHPRRPRTAWSSSTPSRPTSTASSTAPRATPCCAASSPHRPPPRADPRALPRPDRREPPGPARHPLRDLRRPPRLLRAVRQPRRPPGPRRHRHRDPERVRLSDAICTALQIVEHLQDVTEDLGRDRIYLPAQDMKRFHVQEADLATPSAGASVRALVAYEAERARDLLNEGAPWWVASTAD